MAALTDFFQEPFCHENSKIIILSSQSCARLVLRCITKILELGPPSVMSLTKKIFSVKIKNFFGRSVRLR